MTFNVKFVTYSGMTIPILNNVSRQDAIAVVKRKLRWARGRGQPVIKIGKGEWECETPEDAFMISDHDGFLIVRRAS